jgi:hypothetical protein
LLLVQTGLIAQGAKNIDNFKNYSYKIQGYSMSRRKDGMQVLHRVNGTVFFIRKNSELFLITAKHILSGCNNDSSKINNYPSAMFIDLSKDSSGSRLLKLNSSIISDTCKCLSSKTYPDVIAVRITDTLAWNVFSVEDLICSPYKRVKNSLIIGYPGYKNGPVGQTTHTDPSSIMLSEGNYSISVGYVDTTRKSIDPIHYWIYPKSIHTGDSLGGFSGSPFYVQNQKSKKWRIAGIFVSSGTDSEKLPVMYAVKIDYAIDEINQYFATKEFK